MGRFLWLMICLMCFTSFQDGRRTESEETWTSQISYLEGEQFIQRGITGKGIRIAILDGGFPGVNTHPAFRHLIDGGKIIRTWNFVRDQEDVYTGVSHGTAVLSCIAGIIGGRPMGLAPDSEFLLAVTEVRGEPQSEEENWAKAVDWAIDNGARIIQSSLGYTYHRYFREDLDGKSSIAARAAARAARQGVLIVNCNGNEGQSKWKTLVTPADCDSILSVGAIDPTTGLVAGYSSIGPTADLRLKPNVCAPGKVVVAKPRGGTSILYGTSFSAPIVAGFAACTWQLNPSLSAMDILSMIEKSGHLYPYYDYSHGYGIPKASRIVNQPVEAHLPTVIIKETTGKLTLDLVEKNLPDEKSWPETYIYYHVSDPSGFLKRYGVYRCNGKSIEFDRSDIKSEDIFRCHFNGGTTVWGKNR